MATFNNSTTQRQIYMQLYALYEKIVSSYEGEFGEGLEPYEFNSLYNDVKEFNELLDKFRPNSLKFNPVREQAIKQKISLWYEDGPAFLSTLLKVKYRPIYLKSKRILYEIAKKFVEYPNKMTDISKMIPRDLDKIFDGLTSSDPADGYMVVGKPYLDKFAKGNVSMPLLKKLWSRYVLKDFAFESFNIVSYTDVLNEAKKRGFYNPFEESDEGSNQEKSSNEILKKEKLEQEIKDSIRKIEPWEYDRRINKVQYQNGKMISTEQLFPRDIIEKDPVKPLTKSDLSSRKVRDMAFEIIPNLEWGIPIGYSCLYRRSDEVSKEANAIYEYDKRNQMIIIKAIDRIPKGSEIILKAKHDDFGNLYKSDTVKLDNGSIDDFKNITKG